MSESFGLNEIHKGNWELFAPHFARGALFMVAMDLDIKEVAQAMTRDDTALVAQWLESAQLARPNDEQVAEWAKRPQEDFAIFLIVQPYVLIQLAQ